MTPQEKDRIQNAINHIKSSVDVDPWAVEIAVEAMEKQMPKKPKIKLDDYCEILYRMYCPNCNGYLGRGNKRVGYVVRRSENQKYCGECGQLIDWPEEWL